MGWKCFQKYISFFILYFVVQGRGRSSSGEGIYPWLASVYHCLSSGCQLKNSQSVVWPVRLKQWDMYDIEQSKYKKNNTTACFLVLLSHSWCYFSLYKLYFAVHENTTSRHKLTHAKLTLLKSSSMWSLYAKVFRTSTIYWMKKDPLSSSLCETVSVRETDCFNYIS